MSLSAQGLQDNDRRNFAPTDAEMDTQEKIEVFAEMSKQ